MKKILAILVIMAMMAVGVSAEVNAVTPSTNDENRDKGWAHVNLVDEDYDSVTLQFVSTRTFWSCFEYRSDGDENQKIGDNNYNPGILDGLYPFFCQNNNERTETIPANEYVEVRMVFGAETDERFDWTRFDVLTNPDLDGDGVLNEDDLCPDTTSDVPDVKLGVNRHIWTGENYFTTLVPAKRGKFSEIDSAFSIVDTYGCSCEQILDRMSEKLGGEYTGHYKFGCSKSIVEEWIAGVYYVGPTWLEQVVVPSNDIDGATSVNSLVSGTKYIFEASGTWQNSNLNELDAECRLNAGETEWELSAPRSLRLQVDDAYFPWGTECAADNIYTAEFEGLDAQVKFRIADGNPPVASWYNDNVGDLYVDIYEDMWASLW